MKIKNTYVLRNVAGAWVVLPLSDQMLDFNGMLKLNDSAVLLWRALEQGSDRETLVTLLTEKYEISYQQALADVDEFIHRLQQANCLESI